MGCHDMAHEQGDSASDINLIVSQCKMHHLGQSVNNHQDHCKGLRQRQLHDEVHGHR